MATDDERLRDFDPFEVIDQLGFPNRPTELDRLVRENARMKQALRELQVWLDVVGTDRMFKDVTASGWAHLVRSKMTELGLD